MFRTRRPSASMQPAFFAELAAIRRALASETLGYQLRGLINDLKQGWQDQPRVPAGSPEGGQWGSGDSGAGQGGGGSSEGQPHRGVDPVVLERETARMAIAMGFDKAKIQVSDATETFMLNGKEHTTAGWYDKRNRERPVTIFAKHVSNQTVAGVTAHEIQHAKFDAAMTKYQTEREAVLQRPKPQTGPDIMRADGSLRPEAAREFPVYQAMHAAFERYSMEDFATSDGVSEYSYEWWLKWRGDQTARNYHSAVNETLSEMARIKLTEGKFPDHMGERIISWRDTEDRPSKQTMEANAKRWRDLYRTIGKIWQEQ